MVIVTKQHNKSCHVNHNSSSTRDRASPDNCFISLEKGDNAASEGSDRIKMELPLFFSLDFSSFKSCLFSPFNSIQNVYQQFPAHSFDPILMSFQTSASTLFGERRALNIFQCQWVGFHDSSYPWGDVTSEFSSDLNKIHLRNKKFSFSFKSLLKRLLDCFYSQTSATFWPECKVSEEQGFRKQVIVCPRYYN